ncbi:MAG: hypothetical protein DWQ01_08115 [Planctomycetota bacterium]|nr:MAG: hypothetical protein DWQ01_08115 [Planctomycetota bacterium]
MKLAPFHPGAAPITLAPGRWWVFTDLHLDPQRPEEVDAFADRLGSAPKDLAGLLILGDLFDAYLGPEQWAQAGYRPLVQALQQIRGQVVLLRGNRDVLLEAKDVAPEGWQVADSALMATSLGRLFFSHGDQFCLADLSYQRLRRLLRRPGLRWGLRRLPWAWRSKMARRLRGYSQEVVPRKPMDAKDLILEAVGGHLQSLAAVGAVLGHLHLHRRSELAGGRWLQLLPAWQIDTEAVEFHALAESGALA